MVKFISENALKSEKFSLKQTGICQMPETLNHTDIQFKKRKLINVN